MNCLFAILLHLLIIISSPNFVYAKEDIEIRHELKVVINPESHHLDVQDTVTINKRHNGELGFFLHSGFNLSSSDINVSIIREKKETSEVPVEFFRVKLPHHLKSFILKYSGNIYHPIESMGKEQARGFKTTLGIISDEGVYLSGSSSWYPVFDEKMISFSLEVELPLGWDAVSQGERTIHKREKDKTIVKWDSPEPQEEVFLVAGKFTEYIRAGRVTAMVFLRSPDKELSEKYLNAIESYISMYEKLVGPYPYKKFALVENFWETGFGMPSFTLLGPKVIRFPFIINTSFPHEILHNWWGNCVFPDPYSGNWSEGLTAYLSDHLLKEQQGKGAEYRLETLQKYADYVLDERDFPLSKFHFRYSSPSEAIGYGKSLMFFHMLRQKLGDKIFIEGLQDFFEVNKFKFASFDDLKNSFEKVSKKSLEIDFEQWIKRKGAPKLRLSNVKVKSKGKEFVLVAIIEQIQEGDLYHLRIPIAITMEGQEKAYQTIFDMNKKCDKLRIELPRRPLRIDIDPEFDIFRKLDRDEIPPAVSQALGAKKMMVILPSHIDDKLLKAYQELSETIRRSGPDEIEIKFDKEVTEVPYDSAVTILGWENNFFNKMISELFHYEVINEKKELIIGRIRVKKERHSVVLTGRNPSNKDMAFIVIATGIPEAISRLGRKLPHYHKYSFIVFEGTELENPIKGKWQVLNSPMAAFLPNEKGRISKIGIGRLSQREPLIKIPEIISIEKMMEIIRFLSSEELKGRGLGTKELDIAAEFIAKKFKEAGLNPAGDVENSYFQIWKDPENNIMMRNVIGVIPGNKIEMSDQSVVVGAHYDHLGADNSFYPGADDNASGVAVLIELANMLSKNLNPDRNIVFVAFTGEEEGKKGSRYYVANQKFYPVNKCIGMLNLDTVGRLGEKKLLIIGSGSAKEWEHILREAGFVTGVGIEIVSETLDSSDNIIFEQAGVPAIQVFSGPHLDYHRPIDTVDKIDPEGLFKVASVAKEVIEFLATTERTLTLVIKHVEKTEETEKERKVIFGIVPDFSYSEKGCKVSGILPGSPAEKYGLKEGDIITKINNEVVNGLKDLSDILKGLTPESKISINF